MMTGHTLSVVVSVLCLWTLTGADTEVYCVYIQSCTLPCSFQTGTDVVVHWFLLAAGNVPVHSYYQNRDQLSHQDQRFRDRTSLFKDQVSRGNTSLQLTGVEVKDEGRYKCHTSTTRGNNDLFIYLQVDAPVSIVNLKQEGNRITCSSDGIYPEPKLSWSINPPSHMTFNNTTTVHQTEQQLYNISSSLIVSDTDVSYSCTVSTRRNWRRNTLRKLSSLSVSSSKRATLPCSASNTSLTGFSLTWRFNHNQIILNWTRTDDPYTVSEQWRQQVKSVSESGSLILQDLSLKQEGTYSCELTDEEETYRRSILLKIHKGSHLGITVSTVVVVFVVALAGLAVWYYYKSRKVQQPQAQDGEPPTSMELGDKEENQHPDAQGVESSLCDV